METLQAELIDIDPTRSSGSSKKRLIVSFAGLMNKMGGIPQYEFRNFLSKNFPDADKIYYIDLHKKWYHRGIPGITSNVEETIAYLNTKIAGYDEVIFIGTSAGGYAAILFGALCATSSPLKVISFIPQTILYPYVESDKNGTRKFFNLREVLTANSTTSSQTQYHLYGDKTITDIQHLHHIYHCRNLSGLPGVTVYELNGLDMPSLRNSGELLRIFQRIFDSA